MNQADFSVMPSALQQLQQEIADECARSDLECRARYVHEVGAPVNAPVYDVSHLEPDFLNDPELLRAHARDLQRAVRYLDLRGMLVRPFEGKPHLVRIGGTT